MKRLLILVMLLPLVGWGQNTVGRYIYEPKQPLTYTDGFGYELVEHGDSFNFKVYLDFPLSDKHWFKTINYDGVEFELYWGQARSDSITDRRCFTHEDALNIRNMAWELVNQKKLYVICYDNVISSPEIYKRFCPYCGKKLND